MAHGTCNIEGCDKTGQLKRGMCATCYRNRPDATLCKDDGCSTPVFGLGMCHKHYLRVRRHGSTGSRHRRANGELRAFLQDAASATTDECIILTGHKNRPHVTHEGVGMPASRAVWIIAHGDPGELHVLHSCSDGSGALGCINPRHLYLGTDAENHRDMDEADRSPFGEAHHRAVLTEERVRQIRTQWVAGGITKTALAIEYGVSNSTIGRTIRRDNWARVKD